MNVSSPVSPSPLPARSSRAVARGGKAVFGSPTCFAGSPNGLAALASCFAVSCVLLLLGCGADTFTGDGGATAQVQHHTANGALLSRTQLTFPDSFMPSVKTYGAVGDGVTDDTAAIQRALADGRSDTTADYFGRPKALFFPAGTYLVRDTLQWAGCCVTLQGTGPATSIIRLAPGSYGFGDPAHPKPLVLTPAGQTSFHQNIWDLGFAVAAGNPGATALSYISNNVGSMHDVRIQSEDRKGYSGIDLTRAYAGPVLLRDVEVDGFDVGIDLSKAEYSSTFEGITLQQQNIAGIRNVAQPIAIRGLDSVNSVPALTNSGGFVVLLDANLSGGNKTVAAIQSNNTTYLRNITASGYLATLQNTATGALTKAHVNELLVGTPQTLTGVNSPHSLTLPVEETPSFVSSSTADWVPFVQRWGGDTGNLQTLLNSGKHTIYFPFGSYASYREATVTIPDTVDRIVGFSSVINGNSGDVNGGGIRFVVTSNSTTPLILEQFGYGLKIDHRGSRPIVIRDAGVKDYRSFPGAGKLYLEDAGLSAFTIQQGQKVWARQLNDEVAATKITNQGGSLWILGLKTEQASTVIDTQAGGSTELLGALIYPAKVVPGTDAAFRSTDANVSYIYVQPVYCGGCGYSVQVSETRSGQTTQLKSPVGTYRMPLFVGYQ